MLKKDTIALLERGKMFIPVMKIKDSKYGIYTTKGNTCTNEVSRATSVLELGSFLICVLGSKSFQKGCNSGTIFRNLIYLLLLKLLPAYFEGFKLRYSEEYGQFIHIFYGNCFILLNRISMKTCNPRLPTYE